MSQSRVQLSSKEQSLSLDSAVVEELAEPTGTLVLDVPSVFDPLGRTSMLFLLLDRVSVDDQTVFREPSGSFKTRYAELWSSPTCPEDLARVAVWTPLGTFVLPRFAIAEIEGHSQIEGHPRHVVVPDGALQLESSSDRSRLRRPSRQALSC